MCKINISIKHLYSPIIIQFQYQNTCHRTIDFNNNNNNNNNKVNSRHIGENTLLYLLLINLTSNHIPSFLLYVSRTLLYIHYYMTITKP